MQTTTACQNQLEGHRQEVFVTEKMNFLCSIPLHVYENHHLQIHLSHLLSLSSVSWPVGSCPQNVLSTQPAH